MPAYSRQQLAYLLPHCLVRLDQCGSAWISLDQALARRTCTHDECHSLVLLAKTVERSHCVHSSCISRSVWGLAHELQCRNKLPQRLPQRNLIQQLLGRTVRASFQVATKLAVLRSRQEPLSATAPPAQAFVAFAEDNDQVKKRFARRTRSAIFASRPVTLYKRYHPDRAW